MNFALSHFYIVVSDFRVSYVRFLERAALAASFLSILVPSFPPSPSYSLLQLAPSHPPLPQSLSFSLPRVPQAGSRRPAQTPPRERGGGHHARDRAGSWGQPPQRPARALPRPGLHAPISEEPLGGVGGKSAKRRGRLSKAGLCRGD